MKYDTTKNSTRLKKELEKRILVMDGAMGTLIQEQRLSEEDYHGKRFSAHPSSLNGNNEILVQIIGPIHGFLWIFYMALLGFGFLQN